MGVYVNGKLVGISLPQQNSGGDIITAKNTTGSAISADDRVWMDSENVIYYAWSNNPSSFIIYTRDFPATIGSLLYSKNNGVIIPTGEAVTNTDGTTSIENMFDPDMGWTEIYDRYVQGDESITNYNIIPSKLVTSTSFTGIAQSNIANNASGTVKTLLDGNGSYAPTTATKSITTNGTYTASAENAYGYYSVTVNVPSSSGIGITREISAQGVYQVPSTSFTFSLPSNATDVGTRVLYYAFYGCSSLTSVDLSALTTVSGANAFSYAFYNCPNLTSVDLSALTTISGNNAFTYAFQNCPRLTSVDLSALTTISGYQGLYYAFYGCTGLTSVDLSALTTVSEVYGLGDTFYGCTGLTSVDLSALTTVSGGTALSSAFRGCTGLTSVDLSALTTISGANAFSNVFQNCKSLTSVDLPALTTVTGYQALYCAFQNCTQLTDVYFRSLTTSSFGSYINQFTQLMSGTGTTVTHTLHFPSNLESTISGLTGYPNFGGSSSYVVLAFDLPATS